MGTKISGLTQLASAADADKFVLVDDDATQTKYITWEALKNALSNIGKTQRALFTYSNATDILADSGYYDCDGKIAYWSSQLTLSLAGASADTWYYVYLDYSGITSGTVLTNSEIIFSATAPTWSAAKHGWYNGSDRCIFAVLTDGSGDIKEFDHVGTDLVMFTDQITDLSDTDIDTTWTDVTLSIPSFCTRAQVTFHQTQEVNGVETKAYWRRNGQSGTTGHIVYTGRTANNAGARYVNTLPVATDSSQIIEVKHTLSNGTKMSVHTDGWNFPIGM